MKLFISRFSVMCRLGMSEEEVAAVTDSNAATLFELQL